MGSADSKQMKLLSKNYSYLHKKEDITYGEVQIYQNNKNNQQKIALIKRNLLEKDNLVNKRFKALQDRIKLNHANIIQVYECEFSKKFELCQSYHSLIIAIEYLEENFLDNIKKRTLNKTNYEESELLYLVKSIIKALSFLSKNDIEFNDLHPQNVMIKEERYVKLYEQMIDQQPISNYQKVALGLRKLEYLAPEQLLFLRDRKPEVFFIFQLFYREIYQKKKSIYSVLDSQQCVVYRILLIQNIIMKILWNLISNQCIRLWKNNLRSKIIYCYSDTLKFILYDLLNSAPIYRPGYNEILQKLKKIEKQKFSLHLISSFEQQPLQMSDSKQNEVIEIKKEEYHNIPLKKEIAEQKYQEVYQEQEINQEPEGQVHYEIEQQQSLARSDVQPFEISQLYHIYKDQNEKREFYEQINEKFKEIKNNLESKTYTEEDRTQQEVSKMSQIQQVQTAKLPNYDDLDQKIERALLKSRMLQKNIQKKEGKILTPEKINRGEENCITIILAVQLVYESNIPYEYVKVLERCDSFLDMQLYSYQKFNKDTPQTQRIMSQNSPQYFNTVQRYSGQIQQSTQNYQQVYQ